MSSTTMAGNKAAPNDALVDALRALRVLLGVAAIALAVIQPDSGATRLSSAMVAVFVIVGVANVVANAMPRSPLEPVFSNPIMQIVVDAGLALAVMVSVDVGTTPLVWIALLVPVLDAASSHGSQGAMTAWLAVSIAHIVLQLQTAAPDDASADLVRIALQQLAAVGAIVIPASIIASRTRADLEQTSTARRVADERSHQLRSLGLAAERMAGAQRPPAVVATALEALAQLGFDRVDACELAPDSKRWVLLGAQGANVYIDPGDDPLLDEVEPGTTLSEGIGPTSATRLHAMSAIGYRSRMVAGFSTEDGRKIALRAWSIAEVGAGDAAVESVGVLVTQTHAAWKAAHTYENLAVWSEQLAYDAKHDVLTGLPNRGELFSHLAGAEIGQTALLFLDLDGFKAVNDNIGHDAGDAVLVEVAKRLNEVAGENELVVRLGGDEFVVMSNVADLARVRILALDIIAAITVPVVVGSRSDGERVTASVGTSVGVAIGHEGETGDSLLRRADEAMYIAKAGGGSSHHVSMAEPSFEAANSGATRGRDRA